MRYRATVSFAGALSMAEHEVRELDERTAVPYVACGYLTPAEAEKKEPAKTPATAKKATKAKTLA